MKKRFLLLSSKRTKIVATVGPACSNEETLLAMINAGVNVFRINFSHADYDKIKERVKHIREINEETGMNVAILADLQGPKLRIGEVSANTELKDGDNIFINTGKQILNETLTINKKFLHIRLEIQLLRYLRLMLNNQ